MKKLLLSLTLLLVAEMALALPFETTTSPDTYPIYWYKLKCNGYYIGATSYEELTATSSSSSDYYLWCFVTTKQGKTIIYNKGLEKYMAKGWEFNSAMYSKYVNYVVLGSGNSFRICYEENGNKMYLDCGEDYVALSNSGSYITAIQALVEEPIEPAGRFFFYDLGIYDDHCVINFDYYPGEGDSGCSLILFINGNQENIPYYIQRTNEVQTVEATARVEFINHRIRTIEETKTFTIPAREINNGDVNGDGVVSGADVTSLYNVLLDGATAAGDADVNQDGVVSGADVTSLYNILLTQ